MIDDLTRYLSDADNRDIVLSRLVEHVYLSLVPLVIGLLLAIPLGWLAQRTRWGKNSLFGIANVVYTIPSLAMFVVIPGIIGTQILSTVNVIVALAIYTVALLIRPVADALDAVPSHITAAATAMGFRSFHRFLTVELPLAIPVLIAGVRVASVSNISLVSVGALISKGGLGVLFTSGFAVGDIAPITIGIVLTLLLAFIVDILLITAKFTLTPWTRTAAGGAVR